VSTLQESPPSPAPTGKKWIRVTQVVDGHDVEEWMLIDDVEGIAWPARESMRLLNKDIRRVDAPEKVSGRAVYAHDVRLPGMLYGRLLLCPHPKASVSLDLAPALEVEGVEAAIEMDLGGNPTGYLGQPVAAVAATTPEAAEDGIRAIRAVYEESDWVVTFEQAIAEGAPQVSSRGNIVRPGEDGDLGQARSALAECDAVVEATYTLPVQHHVCLETHGIVVDYRGGDEALIYASTQGTFIPGREAAQHLGIAPSKVSTTVQYMGGGFGSKFGIGPEGQAACLLAVELGRPIHLLLTRSDEFLMAGNRSGSHQELVGGATSDGRFVSLIQRISKLGGIGGGSHPSGRPYIYKPEKHHVSNQSVMTHTDGSRAMRAPGHPQASFAIESLVDELAYAIEMDPLEFRIRNLDDPFYERQLDRAAREIGWYEHRHRTKPGPIDRDKATGIGFAVATWGGGGRPACQVEVRIDPDGSVVTSVGSQDLGTGTRTYVAAITAEEFGLEVADVTPRIGSTDYGEANASGGSTTTSSLAPAVKDAARNARLKFLARLAGNWGVEPETLAIETGGVVVDRSSDRRVSWREACAELGSTALVANGEWQRDLAGNGIHGAQAARVEVDTLTGELRLVKMVGVHDCGLPLNRRALRSQINGGMIESLSYALFEERVIDPYLGVQLTADFDNYKVAMTGDLPEIEAIIDDGDDRNQVIGIAEGAIIPGQSAIANAIFNACGVRLRSLPFSPAKILEGLEALRS